MPTPEEEIRKSLLGYLEYQPKIVNGVSKGDLGEYISRAWFKQMNRGCNGRGISILGEIINKLLDEGKIGFEYGNYFYIPISERK